MLLRIMKIQIFFILAFKLCVVDLKYVAKESSGIMKQDGNLKYNEEKIGNQNLEVVPVVKLNPNKPEPMSHKKGTKLRKPPKKLNCPIIEEGTAITGIAVGKTLNRDSDCIYSNTQVNLKEKQKYVKNMEIKTDHTDLDSSQPHKKVKQRVHINKISNVKANLSINSNESPSKSNVELNDGRAINDKLETEQSLENEHSSIVVKSIKDEIKSMFSPNFKSFIFNPLAPLEAKFQECQTSKNESGTCRYVQHCILPNVLSSIEQFMNNICIIESRYIGVCCPEFPIHKVKVKWQNVSESAGNETVQVPEECGIGTNKRIVGGSDASIKAFPWMVALLNHRKKFYCGGALINNRYVLTAAHCTVGSRNNQIIARLGEFDLSSQESFQEDYKVVEIKKHGHYARMTLRNDIALLKLDRPVVFNEFVKTICLPEKNENYTTKMATLTGWGHVQGGISVFTSDVLQEASFPVITNEECAATHGVQVPPSLICTAAPSKDKGACNGDSGGPLVMLDDSDRWTVIGVVSWGRRGCSTSYPSVFTRVSHYLDWIKEHAV